MCHLSAQPHTNINTHTHTQCTHIQHKMQLSVQRCAILTEHAKRCAILALSHTQMQVCRYTHMHAHTHTPAHIHTHTHAHTHTHMQYKVWLSVQRCAILTKHAKRCAFLALSHIKHTHTHARTHAHTTQDVAVCRKMCHLDKAC